MGELADLRRAIGEALERARYLNAQDETRSRQLSLAITKLEEARHWLLELRDAFEVSRPCSLTG